MLTVLKIIYHAAFISLRITSLSANDNVLEHESMISRKFSFGKLEKTWTGN